MSLPATPSQTIGPFFAYALPFPGGADGAAPGDPDAVTVHGYVYDGAGLPIPDALLEFWQAAPDGALDGAPGTLRRDRAKQNQWPAGALLGRDHTRFAGFTRIGTDGDGHYAIRTLMPAAVGASAPYLAVCLFARGLLHHLYTRVYFAGQPEANAADPLLAALEPERRATLVAQAEPAFPGRSSTYRFDLRIQQAGEGGGGGSAETVFLDFG